MSAAGKPLVVTTAPPPCVQCDAFAEKLAELRSERDAALDTLKQMGRERNDAQREVAKLRAELRAVRVGPPPGGVH